MDWLQNPLVPSGKFLKEQRTKSGVRRWTLSWGRYWTFYCFQFTLSLSRKNIALQAWPDDFLSRGLIASFLMTMHTLTIWDGASRLQIFLSPTLYITNCNTFSRIQEKENQQLLRNDEAGGGGKRCVGKKLEWVLRKQVSLHADSEMNVTLVFQMLEKLKN